MDNINLKNMHLAYQAVYNQELREEFEEINEDFLGVDYLTEESLEDISEEVIYEMLDEGFELDDIESIFEEFILEARVTYGHDTTKPAGRIDKIKGAFKDVIGKVRGAVVQSQGKARDSAIQASERASARGAAIKGAVGGLKNKLKDKIGKVVSAAKAGATAVKKEFTGEAEREANARMLNRKAQRSAKDIARSRSTVNPFEPKALPPGRKTKSGKPFNVGQYQMRSGMQNRKLKQRLGEEVEAWVNELLDEGYDLSDYTWDELGEIYLDEASQSRGNKSYDLYDVILSHLLDEGYADTLEGAEAIMVNMSEDWKETIVEKADNTIRLVYGKGGKGVPIKDGSGNVLRKPNVGFAQQGKDFKNAAKNARRKAWNSHVERETKHGDASSRTEFSNAKQINRMNAIPRGSNKGREEEPNDTFTSRYPHVDDPMKYKEVPTDYRARRRRASGR